MVRRWKWPYDGLKVLIFGLTASSLESKLTVKRMEFRPCRLSTKGGQNLKTKYMG